MTAPSYEAVRAIVIAGFELREFVFGPATDLISIANQTGDVERIDWVLADLQKAFNLRWPEIIDASGCPRRAQLFVPEALTLTELVAIVDEGAWPISWTRPGKSLS